MRKKMRSVILGARLIGMALILNNTPTDALGQEKKSKHRSPNYPQISLREAVAKVRKIYEADKRAGSRVEVALAHMGFQSKNGASLGSLSALKKFGLLEEKEGRLFPTQRAVEIICFDQTDERYRKAIREAAMYPALYSELLERYSEGLPSDRALRAELIADRGFNPNVVDGLISAFKDTLDFAGLPDQEEIESSVGDQMPTMEDSVNLKMSAAPTLQPQLKSTSSSATVATKEIITQRVSPDCVAQVVFDGQVTQRAIEKLIAYLDLAKDNYPSTN